MLKSSLSLWFLPHKTIERNTYEDVSRHFIEPVRMFIMKNISFLVLSTHLVSQQTSFLLAASTVDVVFFNYISLFLAITCKYFCVFHFFYFLLKSRNHKTVADLSGKHEGITSGLWDLRRNLFKVSLLRCRKKKVVNEKCC